MAERTINGTRIRTAWISKPLGDMPVFVVPDDFDADSDAHHEVFGGLLERVPIFCIDTMFRDGKRLQFGSPVPISVQVEELCEIVRLEGITTPVWYGDCSRTSLACRAAKQFPNSHIVLASPFFSNIKPRLTLLRKILQSVLKNGDVRSYTFLMALMTTGNQYLVENPFAVIANNQQHKQLSIEQRLLMLAHCFIEEDDPENMLEDIAGRILVISGTDDPVQHLRLLKERISHLQNCTHKLYECGHTVLLERMPDFISDIYQFIRQLEHDNG